MLQTTTAMADAGCCCAWRRRHPEAGRGGLQDSRSVCRPLRTAKTRQNCTALPRLQHRGLGYPASQGRPVLAGRWRRPRRTAILLGFRGVPREPQVRPQQWAARLLGSSALTLGWRADSALAVGAVQGTLLVSHQQWQLAHVRIQEPSKRPIGSRSATTEKPL